MAQSTQLGIEPVDALGYAAIPATYDPATGAGEVGYAIQPCRMFTLQNFTNETVMWSFDGVNDHLPMLSMGYFTLDISANQQQIQGLFLDEFRTIWVRYLTTPPTSGSVYFTAFYAVDYPQD